MEDDILAKYFSKDVFCNDVAFVVEDKEIWVSRAMLCRYSPVFDAMFRQEFKEKSEEKIPLPGKKFSDIFECVQYLFPCPIIKQINSLEPTHQLLPIAEEYLIEDLKVRVECFLTLYIENQSRTKGSIKSFIDALNPAVKYKMHNVVEKCIPEIAKFPFEQITPVYEMLPLSTVGLILDMKLSKIEFDAKNVWRVGGWGAKCSCKFCSSQCTHSHDPRPVSVDPPPFTINIGLFEKFKIE